MSIETTKLLLDADGAPRDRISGFETEYALNYKSAEAVFPDSTTPHLDIVNGLTPRAWRATRTQHHPDGTRRYLDVGAHPELATAEDMNYLAATHRLLSGHVAVARAYDAGLEAWNTRSSKQLNPKFLSLIANTLNPAGESWASHTSLLTSSALEPDDYTGIMAAHRASRIVWSGAGAVCPDNRGGYRFEISEKAGQMIVISNGSTTRLRPLVNLRDEPLANHEMYRRVHDVSGESVFSPLANALRLATDSIILRAAEVKVYFDDLIPDSSIRAMRQISADPTLQAKVAMPYGQWYSGVELQMAIAERAIGKASAAGNITAQEADYGERWLALLSDLQKDPALCMRRVDWLVKQRLIERELAAKRGSGESEFAVAWSKSADYHRLLPHEGNGMKLLRKGFFEDSPSEDVLDNGMALPETRAKVRGLGIQWLLDQGRDYMADWTMVEDIKSERTLALLDPYDTDESRIKQYLG